MTYRACCCSWKACFTWFDCKARLCTETVSLRAHPSAECEDFFILFLLQ